jgi:hypothetical protein
MAVGINDAPMAGVGSAVLHRLLLGSVSGIPGWQWYCGNRPRQRPSLPACRGLSLSLRHKCRSPH